MEESLVMNKHWKGVDFDGTLAEYDGDYSSYRIGRPISLMLNRVQRWLAQGEDVRIVTARVATTNPNAIQNKKLIQAWLKTYLGTELVITSEKDPWMDELWDDKAVQVISNTGLRVDGRN
jgi:hypothetical protein